MSDYGKENNSCIMTVTVTVMALTLMRKHFNLRKKYIILKQFVGCCQIVLVYLIFLCGLHLKKLRPRL